MIGLLPAAGKAERIHGIPKFLLPVENTYLLDWHVSAMTKAGAAEVWVGSHINNAYLVQQYAKAGYVAARCETMTQTVLSSELNKSKENVLFGMPDTYWRDADVYRKLIAALHKGAHVAVAVFQARPGQHRKGGMCEISGFNRLLDVIDKPAETDLTWIWGAMAWKPGFWPHMQADDPHVGYALPRAIAADLDVRAVYCEGGYYDVGTPEGYFECIRATTGETVHA